MSIREDVLMRPEPTFAPYSVYVDVSPTHIVTTDIPIVGTSDFVKIEAYVSDTFRVWELLDDCNNINTAKEIKLRYEAYVWFKVYAKGPFKIYDNTLETFISDHPVFGK